MLAGAGLAPVEHRSSATQWSCGLQGSREVGGFVGGGEEKAFQGGGRQREGWKEACQRKGAGQVGGRTG